MVGTNDAFWEGNFPFGQMRHFRREGIQGGKMHSGRNSAQTNKYIIRDIQRFYEKNILPLLTYLNKYLMPTTEATTSTLMWALNFISKVGL